MLLDDFIHIRDKEGEIILATTRGFSKKFEASVDCVVNQILFDGWPVASHVLLHFALSTIHVSRNFSIFLVRLCMKSYINIHT